MFSSLYFRLIRLFMSASSLPNTFVLFSNKKLFIFCKPIIFLFMFDDGSPSEMEEEAKSKNRRRKLAHSAVLQMVKYTIHIVVNLLNICAFSKFGTFSPGFFH